MAFISRDYQPQDYPLPLTPEQERFLINQAELENLIRNPEYDWHNPDNYLAAIRSGIWFDHNLPLPDSIDTSNL